MSETKTIRESEAGARIHNALWLASQHGVSVAGSLNDLDALELRTQHLTQALEEIAAEVDLPLDHPGFGERTAKILFLARRALTPTTPPEEA